MHNRAREDGIGMHDDMDNIGGTVGQRSWKREGVMVELEEVRLEL